MNHVRLGLLGLIIAIATIAGWHGLRQHHTIQQLTGDCRDAEERCARYESNAASAATRVDQLQRRLYAQTLTEAEAVSGRSAALALHKLYDATACPSELRDFAWKHLVRRCQRMEHVVPAHAGRIGAMTCSPDGQLLATGGEDAHVRLWRSADFALSAELGGHTGAVMGLVFSPDGRWLYSASRDQSVRVWDCSQSPPTSRLLCQQFGTIDALAGSADGQWLAWASSSVLQVGVRLTVWNRHVDGIHADWVVAGRRIQRLQFSPDGHELASLAAGDHQVVLWNVAEARQSNVYASHGNANDFCFAAARNQLYLAGDTGLRIWNLATSRLEREVSEMSGPDVCVRDLGPPENEGTISAFFSGRFLRFYRHSAQGLQVDYEFDFAPRSAVCWTVGRDAREIWVGSEQGELVFRTDWRGDWSELPVDSQSSAIMALAYSHDGQWLASGDEDGTVYLRRSFDGRVQKVIPLPVSRLPAIKWPEYEERLRFLEFSGNDRYLVAATTWGHVHGIDIRENPPRIVFSDRLVAPGGVTALLSPDQGSKIIAITLGHAARSWQFGEHGVQPNTDRAQSFAWLPHDLVSVALSGDGERLAATTDEGAIRLWNVGTQQLQWEAEPQSNRLYSLRFSPDRQVLIVGKERSLIFRSVAAGDLLHEIPLKSTTPHQIQFSRDGKTLLVGGGGWDVELVDPVTGDHRISLLNSTHVDAVTFSPDGLTVVTGNKRGEVRLWPAAVDLRSTAPQ